MNKRYQPNLSALRLEAYDRLPTLVLGASGFIGRWVAFALSKQDADLYLLVRDEVATQQIMQSLGVSATIIRLDVSDLGAVNAELKNINPEIVFNLVGYGVDPRERDNEDAYLLNAEFAGTLCRAMRTCGTRRWPGQRVIQPGSALEYGNVGGPLDEDGPARPVPLYGRTKLAGTIRFIEGCRENSIPGIVARLFTVYGPGEHQVRLFPSLLRTAKTGQALPMTRGDQRRDFTYVEDAAEGLLRLGLVTQQEASIVNVATGRLNTVKQFALEAAKVLGFNDKLIKFGEIPTRSDEMQHEPVTNRRLQLLTGWHPKTTIREGVARTRDFLAESPGHLPSGAATAVDACAPQTALSPESKSTATQNAPKGSITSKK